MTAATNGQRSPGSSGTCDAAPRQFNGWTDPGIDEIIANPDLTAAAKLVAVTLIRQWAWFKSSCFPSDATIADAIGMSPGHVQRCLAELEQAGYIRRERTPRCRIIWLLWRLGDSAPTPTQADTRPSARSPMRVGAQSPIRPVAQAPSRPVAQSPTRPVTQSPTRPIRAGAQSPILLGAQSGSAPARSEHVLSELDERTRNVDRNETSTSLPSIPNAAKNGHDTPLVAPTSVLPTINPTPAPVRPILDELKAIPGADAGKVRVIANRLAAWLLDLASLGYYISVLAKAAAGAIPIEQLIAAFKAGDRAKDSARRPGAIFCWTFNNWIKPPLPSEINRPVYYSVSTLAPNPGGGDAVTPSPAPPPTLVSPPPEGVSGQAMADITREEEIAELRKILLAHKSPFAALARLKLKEMGASAEDTSGRAAPTL